MQRVNILRGWKDGWWRRRELNSDPKVVAGALYMLSRFSFRKGPKTIRGFRSGAESVKRQDLGKS